MLLLILLSINLQAAQIEHKFYYHPRRPDYFNEISKGMREECKTKQPEILNWGQDNDGSYVNFKCEVKNES